MKEKIASLGALLSASFASICCLGPIVLVGLGLGGAGLAAGLAKYRPWFLAVTAILLGVAFYFTYRKKKVACADDRAGGPAKRDGEEMVEGRQAGNHGSCELRSGGKTAKGALWIITALAVGAASFPQWSPYVMGKSPAVSFANAQTVHLAISGMHCSACAVSIEKSLKDVPGVQAASVDFDNAEAVVLTEPGAVPAEQLLKAVQSAGSYTAELRP